MTESAEQKLLERICNRDGTAMKALYDEYAGLLTAVCSRYIDTDEDVKDIMQESFIRIFSSIGSFQYRGKGSLRAWMTRIVVNTALKHLRDSAKMDFLRYADKLPDVEDEQEMSLEGVPAEVVQEMIRSLPVGYRTVFNMFVIEGFSHNPKNRCYLCKHELFEKIRAVADEQGIAEIAEGSNLDDNGDYRPGLQAVAELGIKSPLRHCGFSKQDIRDMSQYLNIPTWNKQSFACLSSRFPYGDLISEEKLKMVDKAEQLLLDMGFHQLRVRIHGDVARIELDPSEFDKFMKEEVRTEVYSRFKEYGFAYVALDIMGYRMGSMNETIL